MEIKTLLGIGKYTLFVGYYENNLYCLSIIDDQAQVYELEGIYPTLTAAKNRGYSIIRTLESLSQNSSNSH